MRLFPDARREPGSFWHNHSLSIVLISFLLIQSLAFWFLRIATWTTEQERFSESTALWPGFWQTYWAEWMVSVLADTYGAVLLVLASKWFYERGSAESNG